MTQWRVALLLAGLFLGESVRADEVSWVHGGIRNEQVRDLYKRNTLDAGGRYAFRYEDNMYWLIEAGVALTSYSGEARPDDHTGIKAGGGLRYYFERLAPSVVPYAMGLVYFADQERGDAYGDSVTTDRSHGLFHEGRAGVRFSMNATWFLDVEFPLWRGGLFAKRTVKTVSRRANNGIIETTSVETNSTDLYVESHGFITEAVVSLGIRI